MAGTVGYRTLEQDLSACFKKRNIVVESIDVSDGASRYLIKVKR